MKAVRTLASIILALSAIALLIAVALNLANVVGRYVFHKPIDSAEELMAFLLVATVFLANAVVGWRGRQIRMDMILNMLPAGGRRAFDLLADIATIAVSVALIVAGWPAIQMLVEFDDRSQVADIPLVIPQALVPIGLGLIALLVVARLLGARPEPEPDEMPPEAS
jgi:C4-dicarboxylate transporter DctQ subunit